MHQNISEAISNIPVHIGVNNLKNIAFLTIYPLFLKWSKNSPIAIHELWSKSKDWVKMVPLPGVPDVDVIAVKFFVKKGKSCVPQFQAGKGVDVFLEIEHEKHMEIVTHLEELETGIHNHTPDPVESPVCFIFLVLLLIAFSHPMPNIQLQD
jgi:hypothetical protein